MFNYRRFTIYLIIASIVLLGIYSYIVLNHKMLYMNAEYPMWVNVKNRMNSSIANGFNFIYIGDSRAKAGFIPSKFDTDSVNSINLALGGSTPIEGYYTLRNYLSHNHTPEYLLMSYAPFHISQQDTYWQRTAKFNFLEDKDYSDIQEVTLALNDKTTLGVKDKYLNYKTLVGKYLSDFLRGISQQRWLSNNHVLKYLETSKGHYYFGKKLGATGLNSEAKTTSFKPSKLINYYLEKTIKLAKENRIKVFWYTMPFNESSFNATPATFRKEYNQFIENLQDKYGITVLNSLYHLKNTKFSDPSHLYMGINEVTKDIKIKFHNKLNP